MDLRKQQDEIRECIELGDRVLEDEETIKAYLKSIALSFEALVFLKVGIAV